LGDLRVRLIGSGLARQRADVAVSLTPITVFSCNPHAPLYVGRAISSIRSHKENGPSVSKGPIIRFPGTGSLPKLNGKGIWKLTLKKPVSID